MSGILYIVPTPVGNLEDMTFRAVKVLREADFILAEDTRTSGVLMKHYDIHVPMRAHHRNNEHRTVEGIVEEIEGGARVALVSDAGTPGISDPGFMLARACREAGIEVVCLPGPTAFVPALVASGLPCDRFVFEGFLPVPKRERRERLDFLQKETRTMIFYEAPHKLRGTLDDLAVTFGTDRSVSLCRELTKLHEEIKKTTLGEAVAFYRENDPRGEYVLVLAGADPARLAVETAPTLEEAVAAARTLQAGGMPPSAAAKQAAAGTPFSKGQIYKELIK